MQEIILSSLGHTWIFDLDGTLLKHNGYKDDGIDSLLPGVKEFLSSIPETDIIIIITSRKTKYSVITENFLNENGIRFDKIIYDCPYGERILFNDNKPSGLITGKAISLRRDEGLASVSIKIDEAL